MPGISEKHQAEAGPVPVRVSGSLQSVEKPKSTVRQCICFLLYNNIDVIMKSTVGE